MARREATVHRSRRSMYATVLWFLLVLFCLRVAGQALVAAFAVPFLPPMRQWYSGVLPYPILLPVQILIIVLLAKVATDFTRRRGFFVVPRRTMGRLLQWSSYLYWGGMAVRYVVSMALHPERRWFGGTIPIFFHCVLATFLFVVGRYHTRLAVSTPAFPPGEPHPSSSSRTSQPRTMMPS